MNKIKPVLNLMLGTACNKKCAYCMQPRHGSNGKIDINLFINKLLSYIMAHHPNGLQTIEYWGGEPLLYLEYIKAIQNAIVDANICLNRNPRIVTNGTLISSEFIDFCNQHNILVNLSWHDGSLSNAQLLKFFQINRVYITSVITHTHLNLEQDYAAWLRLKELSDQCIPWQVYPVHCTDHCLESEYLTKDDVDSYFSYLKTKLSSTDFFYKYILNHLYNTYVNHKAICIEPKCYGQRTLSIDLHGNRYFCHHIMESSNISYNIFDKHIPIAKINLTDKYFSTSTCQSCPHLAHCLGNCYLSNQHDVECYWVKKAYNFCIENKDAIRN